VGKRKRILIVGVIEKTNLVPSSFKRIRQLQHPRPGSTFVLKVVVDLKYLHVLIIYFLLIEQL
jgi:hypothetical protein